MSGSTNRPPSSPEVHSIVRLARKTGSVGANERVGVVFIQANHTFADALLLTDSAIIRRAPKGTIRRSLQESDVNLQPLKRGGSAGGLLIVKRKGQLPTLCIRT